MNKRLSFTVMNAFVFWQETALSFFLPEQLQYNKAGN